jgi:ubiquitin C-terminal hydrolase
MSVETNIVGFKNLGNTCYMNSALQALLSSNIMNTAIVFYLEKYSDKLLSLSPILIEYSRIIFELKDDNTKLKYYSPESFKTILSKENSWFEGFSQHDSHELLVYMINEFAEEKKDKLMATLIKKLCFGKYKRYTYCTECKNISDSYSNFLDVLLPIPNKQNPDIEECFKQFALFDTFEKNNKWECPVCKKKVIAHSKMEIFEVPDIAIFTLNRFTGTEKNTTPVKIYQYIELEGKKLKLIATVNHYGATGGGHYVAHISRDDKWYVADDSRINQSSINDVLNNPSVYMMIYQIDSIDD